MFDQIYLTGFKSFGNVDVNPTELLIDHFLQKEHPRIVKATKLDVVAKQVDDYFLKMKEEVKEEGDKKILHLHMGVGISNVYCLEKFSYNNKTFAIPDNCGYQPIGEPINEQKEFDQSVQTSLPINNLLGSLEQCGYACKISNDPGRYLCNYIYYCSLGKTSGNEQTYSLFVHFPDLKKKSHEQNVNFVNEMIRILCEKKE